MLVYRFLSERWALDALRDRRLKLALIHELNDPFELLGVDLRDKRLRLAFQQLKVQLSATRRMLCFSKQWHNPVLWSHYADKHKGLALGFEVPPGSLQEIRYDLERVAPEPDWLLAPEALKLQHMNKFLATKFRHWEYEAEVRQFFKLEERDPRTGHYFVEFSKDLKLAQVLIGPSSPLAPRDIFKIQSPSDAVEVIPSRLAFKSFQVVRNKLKAPAPQSV